MPTVLVVAFAASSTTTAMWYGGCEPSEPEPEPRDAGRIPMERDAAVDDDALATDAASDEARDAIAPDTPVGR